MAAIFAWRSTALAARHSMAGSQMGMVYKRGVTSPPALVPHVAAGFFGGAYLDMDGGLSVPRAPVWPGFQSTPDTGQIAILQRIVPRWTGAPVTQDLCAIGFGVQGNTAGLIDLILLATGAFRMRYDLLGDGSANSTSTAATYTGYTDGVPVDIMMKWDGTANAGGVSWGVDGSLIGTSTAPAAWQTGLQMARAAISMGIGAAAASNNYDLIELVIFDNAQSVVYTPRTDFWSVPAFDGHAALLRSEKRTRRTIT